MESSKHLQLFLMVQNQLHPNFVALVSYVKYPKLDVMTNIWKRKEKGRESRYLKLCNEFRAFIRCMKAAFYRLDYPKLLMYPLIKRSGRAFVSKHTTQPLLSFWNTWPSLLGLKRKLKVGPRVWKARPRVCVTTRTMLSQSATVIHKLNFTSYYEKNWTP